MVNSSEEPYTTLLSIPSIYAVNNATFMWLIQLEFHFWFEILEFEQGTVQVQYFWS